MNAVSRRIPQPPHSAGQAFKGLRSRIDPEQIPSPLEAAGWDDARFSQEPFLTASDGVLIPLAGTQYRAVDQGKYRR